MNNKFLHGRVVIADRSTFFLLLLSVCFLAGALIGHRFAYTQAVCSDAGLQAYLASFFSLLERGDLPGAPFGASLISYCKYPVLIFVLGYFAPGRAFFPILFFYQGFSASFAVSAFLYAAGEHGVLLAFLLFGLRWALVLPCCFFLAAGAVSAPAPPPRRRETHPAAPEGLYRVSRFAFCILLLGVGAFFEHLFLPEWLCIVS